MTITVDELTADFTRDRWGRPLVSDPNGGPKPIPYGRPSSFGDMIADKYNLQLWGKRQVAYGMAHTPSLVARAMALTADDKKAWNQLAEDALTAAKSNERADIGTALHRIIERQIAGEDVELVEPYAADVRAFWDCLTTTGFKIHQLNGRPMSEVKCVNDDWQLAGTFDLVLEGPDGTYYIADLKTGASLDFGHIGYAVQLAVYRDSFMYDCASGVRSDMPLMHALTGIIVHLPAGEGRCSLMDVDLERGREMARLCAAVRDVRKVKTISARPMYAPDPVDPELIHSPEMHSLLGRIDAIKADEAAFLALRTLWPAGVPTQKDAAQWTAAHVEAITAVVVIVERDHSMPFMPEPFEKPATTLNVAEPEPAVDVEGPRNEVLAAILQDRITALPQEARDVLNGWAFEANASGSALSLKQLPSERRCQIVRICVAALDTVDDINDKMRGFLELNLGAERVQPGFTTGAVLGSLTLSEASRLAEIID